VGRDALATPYKTHSFVRRRLYTYLHGFNMQSFCDGDFHLRCPWSYLRRFGDYREVNVSHAPALRLHPFEQPEAGLAKRIREQQRSVRREVRFEDVSQRRM